MDNKNIELLESKFNDALHYSKDENVFYVDKIES